MPTARALNDDEEAVWRAFVLLWRQGFPRLEPTFRRVGLNHLEYGFLAVLTEQPEGSLGAGELAALAGISPSRLSHRLKQLEANGDIERRTDPHDARSVLVTVTSAGRRKVDEVYLDHLADVRRLVFDRLDEQQTRNLAEAMTAIAGELTGHHFLPRAATGA